MKSILFPILAAGASLFTLSAQAANDSGQINFEGELTAQTCEVLVDGNPANPALVKLPKISTSGLQTSGAVDGQVGFNMTLRNCAEQAGTAAAFFEYNANFVDSNDGTLKNLSTGAGAATLVGLQLVDGQNGASIAAGQASQLTNSTKHALVAGAATLPYAVQYISKGAATAGQVSGSVTYSVQYD